MARIAIELILRQMEAAYRADPFNALRRNLESVHADEWKVEPAEWSADEFGTQPELSICDLVLHIIGSKLMCANRTFSDGTLHYGDIRPPADVLARAFDMESVLAWLDLVQTHLAERLVALHDDAELAVERPSAWGMHLRRDQLLSGNINHSLYHSGEINRQRALMRGASGWAPKGDAATG